jgi:hypothetical protein
MLYSLCNVLGEKKCAFDEKRRIIDKKLQE